MNLTLPRYMINKERRGNVEYTIPRPYPDICFIVNVWDVPILTHPRNNFRENSVSAWVPGATGVMFFNGRPENVDKLFVRYI